LKQKLRREQLLADKQIAETELVNAQRLLGEFTKNITEKNELIESLREKTNEHIIMKYYNNYSRAHCLPMSNGRISGAV